MEQEAEKILRECSCSQECYLVCLRRLFELPCGMLFSNNSLSSLAAEARSRSDIINKVGIPNFNETCRSIVMT